MSSSDNSKSLSDINNQFVTKGETFPSVTMADGFKVQTGTVGALLINIKFYDRMCKGEAIEEGLSKEQLEERLRVPIPTLAKVGMFDIFPVDDWIAGRSAGRSYVGKKAKEMGY